MGHRQKGKGKKRRKASHRGRSEAARWSRAADASPNAGDELVEPAAPLPIVRGPGKRIRGPREAL